MAHAGFQYAPCLIDNRQLAARAEARVDAQRHLPADGRLHQQLRKILTEDPDRAHIRPVSQPAADLPLQRRSDQAAPCVLRCRAHDVAAGAGRIDHRAADRLIRQRLVNVHRDLQHLLPLAAVERQNPVIRRAHHRLFVIGILPIDMLGFFRLFGLYAAQHAAALHQLAQLRANARVVADVLGDDVLRQLDRCFDIRYALLLADIGLRQPFGHISPALEHDRLRQRLYALFPRDHRARTALLLEGTIDVLQRRQRLRAFEHGTDLVRHLALLLDRRADLFAALVEAAQVFQPLAEAAQLLIVHRTGLLLAVARDKRNGVSLVNQRNDSLCNSRADFKFLSKNRCDIHDSPITSRSYGTYRSPSKNSLASAV